MCSATILTRASERCLFRRFPVPSAHNKLHRVRWTPGGQRSVITLQAHGRMRGGAPDVCVTNGWGDTPLRVSACCGEHVWQQLEKRRKVTYTF